MKAGDFEKINKNLDRVINEKARDLLKNYGLTKQDLKNMYFKNDKISVDNCDKLATMLGDLNLVQGIHKFAQIQMEKNPHPNYFYQFSYDEELSPTRLILPNFLKGIITTIDI